MSRIRVAMFEESAQAEPVCLRLRGAGVPAELRSEPPLARLWFVSKANAGIRLEVPAACLGRARELLLSWDTQGLLGSAIRCPECRSLRVDYPQFTEKSLLTNLLMGLAARLGALQAQYYCENCHRMWPREDGKPKRERKHMAPDYFVDDPLPKALRPSSPPNG